MNRQPSTAIETQPQTQPQKKQTDLNTQNSEAMSGVQNVQSEEQDTEKNMLKAELDKMKQQMNEGKKIDSKSANVTFR